MKRTLLFVLISLLATACVTMAAYLVIYHHSYEIGYDELDFETTQYQDGVLTVKVKAELNGEYLYRVIAAPNEDGNYELTFRGGKQSALAQDPGKVYATFEIEIPEGYISIVCSDTPIYTIREEG